MKPLQRRFSKQRQIILEAVKSSNKHPTAEEVYMKVKEKSPGISLGTVYRNLNLLAELGDIINLNAGMDCDHFDGICIDHSHLVCLECKQVFDIDYDIEALTQDVNNKVGLKNNAEIQKVRVTAVGLCSECKKSHNTNPLSQCK